MDTGTGLFDAGKEMSEADVEALIAESASAPDIESALPDERRFDAPKIGAVNSDFDEFAQFDAPKARKKKTLGPQDNEELSEFFTQDGIGQIVARGFNAFFVACGADKMEQAEYNNMAKMVAYYCRARLPKGAGEYQPELLLGATLVAAVAPRLGPIAEKTEPTRKRFADWVRGLLRKRKE